MEILLITAKTSTDQTPENRNNNVCLPALSELDHHVQRRNYLHSFDEETIGFDLILIDTIADLLRAKHTVMGLRTQTLESAVPLTPIIAVVDALTIAMITHDWQLNDLVFHDAAAIELEARFRLALPSLTGDASDANIIIRQGDLIIDLRSYSVKVRGKPLDLTFKEFELLRYLASHPGRVFSRDHLLRELWGYDYFGGTRTVDVHIRRLRAKLGTEHDSLIATVRQVGYRFSPLDN